MIKDTIQKAMVVSLKAGNQLELKTLRFILSVMQYAQIDKQKELTDEEIVSLLHKEVKKRKEAIELFKKGKREDLVIDEQNQITIIERYLPKQVAEDELQKIVDEAIALSNKDESIGKVIGIVMGKVKGRADGAKVAQMIKSKLQSPS